MKPAALTHSPRLSGPTTPPCQLDANPFLFVAPVVLALRLYGSRPQERGTADVRGPEKNGGPFPDRRAQNSIESYRPFESIYFNKSATRQL